MAKTSYSTQKKILLNKKSKLFIEACCILQITICLFLVTALFSYNRCDPSWTNSIYIDHIANWSGRFGAWIADVMLMMFGLSSYWMIAPLCRRIVKNYHLITSYHLACNQKKEKREKKKDNWLIEWIPFLLILLSSDGIEALWMWSMKVEIPLIPGGIIGNIIAHYVLHTLGFPAGTVALITTFLTGLSLYFCFSWLWIANFTGSAILFIIHFIRQCIGFGCDLLFYKNFSLSLIGEDKKKYRIKNKNCKQIEIFGHVIDQVEYSQDKKQQTSQFFSHLTDDSFFPTISLLDPVPEQQKSISTDTLEFTSRLIEKKLNDFGVNANVVAAYPGPIITRFEIDPAIGIKGSQITRLSKDLARSLSCVSIRVIETIPDKTYMALEIPNQKRHPITLSEIISSDIYKNSPSILTLSLGKDVSGKPIVTDLSKAPHILVAGTTGSGKSVGINAMILSLLYKASPKQIRLILIDPKMIELSVYEGIPHLLAPVVTDMKLAKSTLDWCIEEIERRYRLMSDFGVRNLASFNKKIKDVKAIGKSIYNSSSLIQEIYEPMAEQPLIVIIIDELADLMIVAGKRVEEQIVRIAQKARAAGIHLILATQRPSVDVITGLIKANIPTRIAFQVSSKIDSRTILDQAGAESLLGMGDMLFLPPGTGYPQRLHGAFVGDEEVHRVVEKLKRNGKPKYVEELLLSCGKKNSDCGIIKNEQKKQVLSQPTS